MIDFEPEVSDDLEEILAGLTSSPKYFSAKFNYDDRGARLYERICGTKDYYCTRLELGILRQYVRQITNCFDDRILLIEFGSGSGLKTKFLFEHLPHVTSYIPIDIAKAQLLKYSRQLAHRYPFLEVLPVCADYTQPLFLPMPGRYFDRRLFFYPGSTIGNVTPDEAVAFLEMMRRLAEPGDALLIGVDLVKDAHILTRAYDDRKGYTVQFNLINPLASLNRRFNADFVVSRFQHFVRYNKRAACVEIFNKSLCRQVVHLNGVSIEFGAGELIERAVAYKYTVESFQKLAEQAGWRRERVWTDDKNWFSVHYFSAV